jgi:hypothetical protein
VLYRLAIIQRPVNSILHWLKSDACFFASATFTHASERWRTLSQRKLAELEQLMNRIKTVRRLLKKLMTKCRCETLDQCGRHISEHE